MVALQQVLELLNVKGLAQIEFGGKSLLEGGVVGMAVVGSFRCAAATPAFIGPVRMLLSSQKVFDLNFNAQVGPISGKSDRPKVPPQHGLVQG